VVPVQVKKDNIGDNFALYCANKKTVFHRLSKLNFLGGSYKSGGSSTLLAEITFRPGGYGASLGKKDIAALVADGLEAEGLVKKKDILASQVKPFKYAYVIYDLHHRKNADAVLGYLNSLGMASCGRFAQFEYINMDAALRNALELAKKLNKHG
jgi:protoporphyrinogen oxidase